MNNIQRVILAALVLAAAQAQASDAEPLTFGLHTFSAHLGGDMPESFKPNNANFGLYVREGQWVAGGYRNTLGRPSLYAGYVFEYQRAALTVGVVSGYQIHRVEWYGKCDYGKVSAPGYPCYRDDGYSKGWLSLLASPSYVVWREDKYAARISYIPRIGGLNHSSVVHLSLEGTF